MGLSTVYCAISGCTEDVTFVLRRHAHKTRRPIITAALKSLWSQHKPSQDDMCVIGPIDPSGDPLWDDSMTSVDLHPETDIRVVPRCVMGNCMDNGYVGGPERNGQAPEYYVSRGYGLMVQTYALDIMALATRGRMTPLRLWHLARKKEESWDRSFEGVDYGGIEKGWGQFAEPFLGFTDKEVRHLEQIGNVKVVEQRLVHQGRHWLWMPPDRFPVSKRVFGHSMPGRKPIHLENGSSRSTVESLPFDVLISIVSSLPLLSVLSLANTSRLLHTAILDNEYLACYWLYESAPWWIPVPTQTPFWQRADSEDGSNDEYWSGGEYGSDTEDGSDSEGKIEFDGRNEIGDGNKSDGCSPEDGDEAEDRSEPPTIQISQLFLASGWTEGFQLSLGFPSGLDWPYVIRCARSGSMRNRERIWNTVLDIERVADLAGI